MRAGAKIAAFTAAIALCAPSVQATPNYSVEEAVAVARKQNPEIAMARKQIEAAHGASVEARAGFLPSVLSSGLLRKRERQEDSRLRDNDYNASVRVVQNLYSGGAVSAQTTIARLNEEKRAYELQALENRVAMDVRVAFYDLQLTRAKIRVREQSVGVLQEELKTQRERLAAGTVGELNVRRAEVALANEQPELIDAQTRLQLSYLQLGGLLGVQPASGSQALPFEIAGQIKYQPRHPDLNECLAYADIERPEIKARQCDVEIETAQLSLDGSELRPHVEAFSGYEVYSERDPEVGREFNHGYVVGLNASWHIFDGFATRGRQQATRARRQAALEALKGARLSAATDVRSAFLDLQQAERVLQSETRNVQTADESLEAAKGSLGAGLGTQLDVLQAASDVTRTRTTRLSAIYLHNAALARLARASARQPADLGFAELRVTKKPGARGAEISEIAKPPALLGTQR